MPTGVSVRNLLRMPLSEIMIYSYLAASYPGFMLFIFGFTPTFEPPVVPLGRKVGKYIFD